MGDGLARLDRGEIDVFDVDALIERYDLAARKLRAFCGSSGADWERAAGALEFMRENGEAHDWWDAATARRR